MQRRGGSIKPAKDRHTPRPKARKAPTARVSTDDLQDQLDRRTRERDEALEYLAATSEVLQVISQSAFDLKSVLQALVESAARLCKADKAAITRQIGGEFFFTETYGLSPEFIEHVRTVPVKPERGTVTGLALLEGRTIHVSDVRVPRDEIWAKGQRLGNFRTILGVPMLREGTPIGVLGLMRTERQPFTDKQIALVTNFAAQAVIAIENTRLLNELRQRTDDLSESLEQQTATSEVLKVISSSPGELPPVFNTMLANATRICEAKFGVLYLREGGAFRAAATTPNAPPEWVKARKPELLLNPPPDGPLRRITATKQVVQIADLSKLQSYLERHPFTVAAVELGRFRTALGVPMLKDGEVVGAITILRQEVRPFTDKQIKLMENFAAQAVIAIENTRLLNELRQRTDDLSESLEQQTATSEVLKVVSTSRGELEPVFQAMLENAMRICEAKFGILFEFVNGAFRALSSCGLPAAFAEFHRKPRVWGPDTGLGQLARTKQTIHVEDTQAGQSYSNKDPGRMAAIELGGVRTFVAVPMLKEDELIGAIIIHRQEVRPFTEKQIALLTNFAAQAVIAIENARLLNELRQRTDDLSELLEQQTATSEVLKIISSSPGELEPVFNAMLENAIRICGAGFCTLFHFDGKLFDFAANYGTPTALVELQKRRGPFLPERGGLLDRVLQTRQVAHSADYAAELSEFHRSSSAVRDPRSLCPCSRITMSWSAPSLSIARRFDRSLISRLSWYRTSPPRPS